MKEPAPLPFLARPGYRRRRLIEAIRLLPYAGAVLFLMPSLWASGSSDATTSHGLVFIFVVWVAMIAVSFLAARALHRAAAADEDTEAR